MPTTDLRKSYNSEQVQPWRTLYADRVDTMRASHSVFQLTGREPPTNGFVDRPLDASMVSIVTKVNLLVVTGKLLDIGHSPRHADKAFNQTVKCWFLHFDFEFTTRFPLNLLHCCTDQRNSYFPVGG